MKTVNLSELVAGMVVKILGGKSVFIVNSITDKKITLVDINDFTVYPFYNVKNEDLNFEVIVDVLEC